VKRGQGRPERQQGRSRRPTIKDVARAARVSPATVSNVLLGRSSVAAALVERVHKVVGELGYRTDVAASNLRRRQTAVIGLLVPDFANPFFAALTARIELLARRAGYRLVVASTAESAADEEEELRTLIGWRAAGLIVVPTDPAFAARRLLAAENIPTVIADRIPEGIGLDRIGVDNAVAARAAVARLLELGHRRILVVASDGAVPNIRERIAGARAAATGAASTEIEVIVGGKDLGRAAAVLEERLARAPAPTAVFALTSVGALAALRAARRLDLAVPEALSLVSFDDTDWMEVLEPSVSAVHQPVEAVAEAAFTRLLARLGGDESESCDIRLACRIEWRRSTAAPALRQPDRMTARGRPNVHVS
jgi:LacI family transcriptional regulator